jgi:hypothetical protein
MPLPPCKNIKNLITSDTIRKHSPSIGFAELKENEVQLRIYWALFIGNIFLME